jgi:hypothetical protein
MILAHVVAELSTKNAVPEQMKLDLCSPADVVPRIRGQAHEEIDSLVFHEACLKIWDLTWMPIQVQIRQQVSDLFRENR